MMTFAVVALQTKGGKMPRTLASFLKKVRVFRFAGPEVFTQDEAYKKVNAVLNAEHADTMGKACRCLAITMGVEDTLRRYLAHSWLGTVSRGVVEPDLEKYPEKDVVALRFLIEASSKEIAEWVLEEAVFATPGLRDLRATGRWGDEAPSIVDLTELTRDKFVSIGEVGVVERRQHCARVLHGMGVLASDEIRGPSLAIGYKQLSETAAAGEFNPADFFNRYIDLFFQKMSDTVTSCGLVDLSRDQMRVAKIM